MTDQVRPPVDATPFPSCEDFENIARALHGPWVAWRDCEELRAKVRAHLAVLAAAQETARHRDDLLVALKAVLAGFDDGMFVRNIDEDGQSGWAMKFLPYFKALADAKAAIEKAERR